MERGIPERQNMGQWPPEGAMRQAADLQGFLAVAAACACVGGGRR
jgi:hypothetical protein